MKADKTYVYMGAIYLPGAEMPEGWTPPKQSKQDTGVTMYGPEGILTELPGIPLPANIKKDGESVPEGAPVHMGAETGAGVVAPSSDPGKVPAGEGEGVHAGSDAGGGKAQESTTESGTAAATAAPKPGKTK